eukprot:TRINITY_DN126561_c0_g1_i1.p1 TRINITY_DN126561_c0_g1~~TRINITY_DN126561_c0_g1_i1.p1  ORF type:complete len:501 (-),score=82.47 TRINITY_DN126561_c0_g1_i1:335-1693(-)
MAVLSRHIVTAFVASATSAWVVRRWWQKRRAKYEEPCDEYESGGDEAAEGRFDCVVIGGGMVGSAAAYHLCRSTGLKVALVAGEAGSFSSHNDAHRLVQQYMTTNGEDVANSMRGYAEVEKRSDIKFYNEVGLVGVQSPGTSAKNGAQPGAIVVDGKAIDLFFPGMSPASLFNDGFEAVIGKCQGWLDPRKFVEAHQKAAETLGCSNKMVNATSLERRDRRSSRAWDVTLSSGERLVCNSVVLALGAWTNISNLLPKRAPRLDLELWGKTLYHLEVDEEDAKVLAEMPCVIIRPDKEGTVEHQVAYVGPKSAPYVYLFPPTKYELDGTSKFRIKIGHSPHDPLISSVDGADDAEKLDNWMRGRGQVTLDAMEKSKQFFDSTLRELFPAVKWGEGIVQNCVTAKTFNGQVFLGEVPRCPGVFINTGCNGSGAAKAHEWGRLLSVLVRSRPDWW